MIGFLPLPVRYRLARLVAPFYRGDRITCPVCGGRFRKLLSAGRRRDALCPRCGSLERHRLFWLYLQRTDFFSAPQRVLHIAPEHCFEKRFAKLDNLDYLSADLDSPFAMARIDVQDIPHPDESFDVILCSHVLDAVDDDRQAMRELCRVLSANGWALLQSPIQPGHETTVEKGDIPPERHAEVFLEGSVRNYGVDYFDRLREEGFAVERVALARELGAPAVERYALTPDEELCICRRAATLVT